MPEFEADIGAIRRFHDACQTYTHRQAETIDSALREMESFAARLQEAEQQWRWEVEDRSRRLERCLIEATYAAANGGYVDCSPFRAALAEAEAALAAVIRARHRFETAVYQFRAAADRYTKVLDAGMGRARRYLDACIDGFTNYRSMQFWTAPAFSDTLMPSSAATSPASSPPFTGSFGGSPESRESAESREREPFSRG